MKRILFISPCSYPVVIAECIVNMKLLQALSNAGEFEIDLVSRDHPHKLYKVVEPLESFNVKLDKVHVETLERKINFKTIWLNLVTLFKFGFTFRGAHWAAQVLPLCEAWVKEKNYDYIVSKDYPSFLVASYLKKHYQLKWVATWNDPYPFQLFPEPYGHWPKAKLSWVDRQKIRIMRQADTHIFPSDRLRDYMCEQLALPVSKTLIVPHVVVSPNSLNLKDTHLRLLVSGNMKKPRDLTLFLRALHQFYTLNPEAEMRVDILGLVEEEVPGLIQELGLSTYVKVLPSVSYNESLEIAKKHQVCILIEAPMAEGIYLPTKVSDFMQNGNVIFAISPSEGVLNDIYKEGYIGYFADNTQQEMILEQLNKLYQDYRAGVIQDKAKVKPEYLDKAVVKQYLDL